MTNTKPKICLNMIVKDEGHVIKETLETIYKYIDYYVINDTGSTDNTKEVITEFFDGKGIKGEIVTHEFRSCKCHSEKYKRYSFFHFGWNRTYAMKLCEGKSDYIWIIDADDLIVGNLVLPKELKADCYMLTYGKGFTYQRAQIFRNDSSLIWHYKGARHEYPTCKKNNHTKIHIEGDYYIDSRRLGARSSDPQKYLSDAKVFEELLLEEPNNDRYAFYCGQSYFDHGDFNNAIRLYRQRIKIGGWFEEVFYSYYKIATALEHLNSPWKEIEKAYLDAYNYCKDRMEPLYHIAKHYRLNNEFEKGYDYAKKASKIPYPKNCVLFIYKDVYDYKIWDELALGAFYTGKYMESYSIFKRLLDSGVVPADELKRIQMNLQLSKTKLDLKNKKTCCFYVGDEVITKNTPIYNVFIKISDLYNVFVIGTKIDLYNHDHNIIVLVPEIIKSIGQSIKVDYLILYNSLNYYYDNLSIENQYTFLIQNDQYFKLTSISGMDIFIYNQHYLNNLFKKVSKVVCLDSNTKQKISEDYKIPIDHIDSLDIQDKNDIHILFDENLYNYKFQNDLVETEINGLIYTKPTYIKKLQENKEIYDFSKNIILNSCKELIKKYSNIPETLFYLAKIYLELGDTINCQKQLEKILSAKNISPTLRDNSHLIKAKILHDNENYEESYSIANDVIQKNNLPESMRLSAEDTRDMNIDYLKDKLLKYNSEKVNRLKKLNKDKQNKVMLSITTCKRFDLFEKTINSFLNCCEDTDLIDIWLCVDDNSSTEDRNKMKILYPFFTFIFKNENQKGHYVSMNMIRDEAIKNNIEYILHMEDDFHYVYKTNYITKGLKILAEDEKIGQVLFNRNYAEIEPYKRRIPGGFLRRTKDGLRYYIHEHYDPDSKEYQDFINRHKNFGTCGYWPHFSFRPSILKVSMLKAVGSFYNTGHFEMQYANEYKSLGFKSAFFDTFSCIHIGKKTWEKSGINSYHLNKTGQFSLNTEDVSIFVMSNYQNTILWKNFKEHAKDKLPYYTRQIPRTVKQLNDIEKHIFVGNEFHYFRPIINQIMSFIDIFRNNKSKYVLILRENITLTKDLQGLFNILKDGKEYEFISLDEHEENDEEKITIVPKQIKINLEKATGFIVSESGMKKLLAYITANRIKNLNYLDKCDIVDTYILNKQYYDIQEELDTTQINHEYVEFEGYKFYSHMDSFGEDIGYHGRKHPTELKAICDKDDKAVCFNTLGYIKKKVVAEKDFIYLPFSTKTSDGLYIKI